jgi:uncharacterized membrane protein YhhN
VTVWIALCAAACGVLLASLRRGSALGVWLAKPVAAGAFVAAAIAAGGLDWGVGRAIVAALALSWIGDVLLIPSGTGACFRAGMAAFGAAHLAFAAAFLRAGIAPRPALVAAAVLAPALLAVARWLRPHLQGPFRLAVPTYVAAIGAMVALSAGAAASLARPALAIGAALFALSDFSVARERFVAPGFANSLWGLPVYFAAQMMLALAAGPGGVAPP